MFSSRVSKSHQPHGVTSGQSREEEEVTWWFTPGQPVRFYIRAKEEKQVTWWFTPSQPVRLYEGEGARKWVKKENRQGVKQIRSEHINS